MNKKETNPDKENTVNKNNLLVDRRGKKKYRGRGEKNSKESLFSVLLANLRGFQSKKHALKKILRKTKPSLVALNETQLKGKMKVNLEPYVTWNRNRTVRGGGGISTSVSPQYKEGTVGAGQGEGEEEYLVTRVDSFSPAFTLINSYGEQRSMGVEEV